MEVEVGNPRYCEYDPRALQFEVPMGHTQPFLGQVPSRTVALYLNLHTSANKQNLLWSKYDTGVAKIRANLKDAGEQRKTGIKSKTLYH